MRALRDPHARGPLFALLGVTCVTSYFSYAYFHLDEYAQIVEPALRKLGLAAETLPPWEYEARIRSWLQPAFYVAVGRALGAFGVRDVFSVVFAWRLLTGLASWAAICAFVGVSLRWFERDEERRLHARVAALLGFLPYLSVRTSQESLSASAFALGFALLLADTDPAGQDAGRTPRGWGAPLLAGALCGAAFELRFQTALLTLGLFAWLVRVGKAPPLRLAAFVAGVLLVVAAALPIDRWGYGAWTVPPIEYVRANLLEGTAILFGSEPPFAYFYLTPANIFLPVVVVLMFAMIVAWWRHPRHAVTWTTAPFFLVHCLITHKEERFLFPMTILATSFVAMAFCPGYGRPLALVRRVWSWRAGVGAKMLAGVNFAGMALLAVYPLGWNHHVPFARFVHEHVGDELHAYAFEDFEIRRPPYGPRVHDVEKGAPEQIEASLEAGRWREFLIADTPSLHTGVDALDRRYTLVYSEFPFWQSAWLTERVMRAVDPYNESARSPLHPVRWRSLYRLQR
jgi:phosphatidylinositol glycan class B